MEMNQNYDQMLEQFQDLESVVEQNQHLTEWELLQLINGHYQQNGQGIYFKEMDIEIGTPRYELIFEFNEMVISDEYNRGELSIQELLIEIQSNVLQMKIIHIALTLVKNLMYVGFILLALIIAIQFLSRRAIKFKMAFKYAGISVLFGSLTMLLMAQVSTIPVNILFMASFLFVACSYALLCLSEFKKAMTADFLGEGRIDYDVY